MINQNGTANIDILTILTRMALQILASYLL